MHNALSASCSIAVVDCGVYEQSMVHVVQSFSDMYEYVVLHREISRRIALPHTKNNVTPRRRIFCLVRGGVGLEYGLVSLRLHCFLRLERALCWHSGRCLAGVAFSV